MRVKNLEHAKKETVTLLCVAVGTAIQQHVEACTACGRTGIMLGKNGAVSNLRTKLACKDLFNLHT
jgi:hypothetical protein